MLVSNLREKLVERAGWLLFGQTCFFFFFLQACRASCGAITQLQMQLWAALEPVINRSAFERVRRSGPLQVCSGKSTDPAHLCLGDFLLVFDFSGSSHGLPL